MVRNMSVPTDAVLPHLYYRDADAAAIWLGTAFGFREVYRVPESDGRIHIAQLQCGNAYVMIRYCANTTLSPLDAGGVTQSVMVIVDDVDAHYARAVAAGAQTRTEPSDMVYGEREYQVIDLEKHLWTFAQHIADVDPAMFTADPA
jgi:uncharacterized glyoxalase superfamily protein PhnB